MSIIVKSGVPGKLPTASQLEYGQLALNYADEILYFKNSLNQIVPVDIGGNTGTVTNVSGTGTVSGITLSGSVSVSGSLTLGGTLTVLPGDFGTQIQKTFLAAPNAADGAPTFRTIVASDIPTLNQNTTGTASNVTGTVAIANGGTGATSAVNARTGLQVPARPTAFPSSNENAVQATDLRTITNPTTGLGYAKGVRFRFSSLNDDNSTPYADVIDLSTYADSSGGGFNALYFGKNSQLIQHKYAAAAGTSWTVKTLAYTDSNITGSAGSLSTGRTISLTGDVAYTSGAFDGSTNVTGTATLTSVGTAGTYTKVTTDAKGRVTSGTTLAASDIPAIDASKITSGTIDAARLPSYVDDVVEATNLAAFPVTGETGKIYVALDTNKTYRWSGSAYIYITSGAVDSVAGKTGVVTLVKADVGLSNVDNTADSTKAVASADTLTTARTINGVSFNGSANILVPSLYDSGYRRIMHPGGAEYNTSTASITGAIAINLPTAVFAQNRMISFTVQVYDYVTNESFTVKIAGYTWSTGWVNCSSYILGNPTTDLRFNVRFSRDATNSRYIVYIGELSTVWAYPQVYVTDLQVGFSSSAAGWESGWSITFEPTAFQTVNATNSNSQIGYATSTNVGNAVVLRDGSGNFAVNGITLGSIQSTGIISVLNGAAAQGIKVGNLVVSNSYSNNAPTNGIYVTGQIQSAVATGTAPFTIASTTLNTNLNADLLDGLHAASANTISTIVARDASGNFSAGTITATLSGNATNVTGTVAIANGGTGATTAATARTSLGATIVGNNLFTVADPSAIRFIRVNADNTVSLLSDADFRTAIGSSGGGGGYVTPTETEIIATAGQTVFSVAYYPSDLAVYLNGVRLNSADYIATDGTSITLAVGAKVGSVLKIKSYVGIPTANAKENVVYVSGALSATVFRTYILRASATLTLPSSPLEGEWVRIVNRSNTVTCVIARNGLKIMGLLEDLTINSLNASFTLVYTDATDGWVLV